MHQVNNRWWNHIVQDETWTLGGELAKSLYIYCTCGFYLYPFLDQFRIYAQYYSYAFTLGPLYTKEVESLKIESSKEGALSLVERSFLLALCSLKSTLHLRFQLDSLNFLPSLEQGHLDLNLNPKISMFWWQYMSEKGHFRTQPQ